MIARCGPQQAFGLDATAMLIDARVLQLNERLYAQMSSCVALCGLWTLSRVSGSFTQNNKLPIRETLWMRKAKLDDTQAGPKEH